MPYIEIGVAAVAVLILVRMFFSSVTVMEYQRGLKYRKGRFQAVLEPGQYLVFRQSTLVQLVDVRPTFTTLTGQELVSTDGVTLKVSLIAQYQVADPDTAVNTVENYYNALYLTVQAHLREIVGSATIDEILNSRGDIGPKLLGNASAEVESFGIRLLSVDIKDIMLPGEVKKLFNQVVKAQKEGQAALEKARAETAALRNLANAARMMDDHPGLFQLRLLQQVGESSGNTIVVGLPPGTPVVKSGQGSSKQAAVEEPLSEP